ncbi:MAG: hypothetical protein ACNI3C_03070 [Candidatus Marinarcus sp.]|uniref:hypothetical protein n=1 Tax=Candidatus Marinarcus sp. TaxID=3100987 RepID=UPI003AFFD565
MILNISKIKTEALLLFCRDIINSYKDSEMELFHVESELDEHINKITIEILTQINYVTKPSEFYLRDNPNSSTKAILNAYNYLNNALNKTLETHKAFNPAMLYFSLLATWFAELQKESKSKEYIYFIIYPYANVYDKMLVNIKNQEFKALNISMINVAEKIIVGFNQYPLMK